ncbi:SIR2 family NAD-dependent protein deacylase [Candidatus Leptofilum sp.]|uniref:SIR2 family NAD-dependent protein deacylase n=1 Tax=Candidatus Leptofilum sp. TaxID=3241576 RepID=UPI003B58FC54
MSDNFRFPGMLIQKLKTAQSIAVLTGAGISAESGVPTFREAQTGLWAKYDPQELATPQAFQRNPKLVWEWYAWRRELVNRATPNLGHLALVELANLVPQLTLITQNVDGLHQQAGSKNVICLHGNIMESKCYAHGHFVAQLPESDAVPPKCPTCGSLLRPNVVWFGENLPAHALTTAVHASQSCDIFFSVGTSALVHPAASLPLYALENQALLVEVNPQPTPLTRWADEVLTGPSGEILPALIKAMQAA